MANTPADFASTSILLRPFSSLPTSLLHARYRSRQRMQPEHILREVFSQHTWHPFSHKARKKENPVSSPANAAVVIVAVPRPSDLLRRRASPTQAAPAPPPFPPLGQVAHELSPHQRKKRRLKRGRKQTKMEITHPRHLEIPKDAPPLAAQYAPVPYLRRVRVAVHPTQLELRLGALPGRERRVADDIAKGLSVGFTVCCASANSCSLSGGLAQRSMTLPPPPRGHSSSALVPAPPPLHEASSARKSSFLILQEQQRRRGRSCVYVLVITDRDGKGCPRFGSLRM